MPWHVYTRLPDGRTAVADHRDPIVRIMRRMRRDSPNSNDLAALQIWMDKNAEQSEQCKAGTCGHDGG